ncbi:MAG: penicillin-binding protein 2 [FCB group bacterium]|nr:penicillin-binding protein 2 [FCB group bacterium]
MEFRIKLLKFAFIFLFLGMLVRIGYLQLYLGKSYLQQSENNRLRVVEEDPVRGFIYDRKGRLIVENIPSYTIAGAPQNILKNYQSLEKLRAIFNETAENGWENSARKYYSRPEIRLKRDIEFASLAAVEANQLHLPGIEVKVESKRHYPYKTATHIIGFLGEINSSELANFKGFQPGDIVGKKGIEKTCNSLLFGKKGYRVIEVDASGNRLADTRRMKNVEPQNGSDIYLTIDLELQEFAEEMLAGWQGAVVALDPANGDILVMASSPDYNPEHFAGVLKPETWNSLLDDPAKPLLNRCIQGTYPPGSITKMAVLAAALEEKVIDPKEKIVCPGFKQMGNRTFRCWNEGGHGAINAYQAIEQSCDVYFYEICLRLGIDKMAEYYRKFGLGNLTGIDIEGELPGLIPDSLYMDSRYGVKGWTKGHLLNISIGQGDVLVTPLQGAVFCAALANRGKIPVPHLFKSVLYHNPDNWEGHVPEYNYVEGVSEKTYNVLLRGMWDVVHCEHGTAHWLREPDLQIAGKTGTAQNPHGEDHAWFIGFGPYENPEIVVCALVEHGEHGTTMAAPIVVKLIKQYLRMSNAKSPVVSTRAVG